MGARDGTASRVAGPGRRRRWSQDQRRAIVAEALAPDASVCVSAWRANVVPRLIYRWILQRLRYDLIVSEEI